MYAQALACQIIPYGNNPKAGNFIKANGNSFYYETYGKGEPLVLLHGGFQSIAVFKNQIPAFSKQFKVILIDTRGHGKSANDTSLRLSYDLFAEDVNKILELLKINNVNIVGWSDGGNTALLLALKYPERLKKVCFTGTNLFSGDDAIQPAMLHEWKALQKKLQNATKVNDVFKKKMIEMFLTEPNHTFEELKNINIPILIMAGQKDIIKEQHTREIAKNIKSSSLLIFPNETHFVVVENPALFNKTVLDFLK